MFGIKTKVYYFCPTFFDGVIAQLVEQRTENPCVPSSILGDATLIARFFGLFFLKDKLTGVNATPCSEFRAITLFCIL